MPPTAVRTFVAIGTIPRALGQQWIVMVATEWGEHYRKRFAAAERVELNAIQDAGMAHIHRMRNDVAHHGSIASKQNTGHCEVFKWFAPDDVIHPMMAPRRGVHVVPRTASSVRRA